MPLYEFRCPEGHDFETFYRSISAAPAEERCPVCRKVAARLMSTAGLVFKGSGFYITDYGKDGKKAERDAAKTAADKSETKTADSTAPKTADAPAASSTDSGSATKPAVAPAATPAP